MTKPNKPNLSVASEQGSPSSVNIEHPDVPLFQPITYIRLIHRNLPTQNRVRIRPVLSDGRDLELGLHLTGQPNVDVVHNVLPGQMPPLGELTARQPDQRGGSGIGSCQCAHGRRGVGGTGGEIGKRLLLLLGLHRRIGAEEGHEAGASVGVGRRRYRLGLERRSWEGEGTVLLQLLLLLVLLLLLLEVVMGV